MKTAFIISTTVAVVLVLIIGASLVYAPTISEQPKAGGIRDATIFSKSGTSTTATVPAFSNTEASTTPYYRLLATSTPSTRSWCLFANQGPSTVFLALNADAAPVYQSGIMLTASSTFEIDADNLYTGSITGKAAGATSTLAIECY